MLTALGIAAFVSACVLTGRWLLHRHDELGRARRAPTIAVPLLLVVALVSGVVMWRHHQMEAQLTMVATAVAGGSAKVTCQTLGGSMVDAGGELGYVKWSEDGTPERRTLIKRDTCNDLAAFMRDPIAAAPDEQIVAVHVLTHEAMHMRGERAEPLAECQAMQRNSVTARLLGASEADALELARRYWTDFYPRQNEAYLTSDCAPGRSLDEGLPDPPW